MDKQLDKNIIRKQILAERNTLSTAYIQCFEESALKRFLSSSWFVSSEVIMLYMDFRKEAPTKLLIDAAIKSKKKLVLPLTDKNFHIIPYFVPYDNSLISTPSLLCSIEPYLVKSSLGIWEPNPSLCHVIDPLEIDFIIVPGVAFDPKGNRLGYGKGCYDEFLPKLRPNAIKLGLAYDFQILDQLPQEPKDIKVDGIL